MMKVNIHFNVTTLILFFQLSFGASAAYVCCSHQQMPLVTSSFFEDHICLSLYLSNTIPALIIYKSSIYVGDLFLCLIEFIGVTFIHKTIQISSVQLNKTSSAHFIV